MRIIYRYFFTSRRLYTIRKLRKVDKNASIRNLRKNNGELIRNLRKVDKTLDFIRNLRINSCHSFAICENYSQFEKTPPSYIRNLRKNVCGYIRNLRNRGAQRLRLKIPTF